MSSTSDGFTGGIAAQGSAGYIEGSADAEVLGYSTPDRYVGEDCNDKGKCSGYFIKTKGENAGEIREFDNKKDGKNNWDYLGVEKIDGYDVKAGAGAGAGIDMYGWSYSESYRAIDNFDGGKTESMGTFVGAGTEVNSYGYDYDWDKGCIARSGARVDGGYIAAGGAATLTVQSNGYGTAKAVAVGGYVGAGQLGSNYQGSAVGYSKTSITTLDGFNGSINSASAGMQVTSAASNGGRQLQ